MERFNKASDNVNSSIENINRTVTQLERSMTSGTINGITSMGNAIDDLNNNVIELIDSFQKARKELSSNAWNLAINGIADIFGGGVQKNFEKDLSKDKFIRVHKTYIINIDKVERFNSKFAEIGITKIPLSRNKKEDLVRALAIA